MVSAFNIGKYKQLSYHKEPPSDNCRGFFVDYLATDKSGSFTLRMRISNANPK
jgi:hypothetical protein